MTIRMLNILVVILLFIPFYSDANNQCSTLKSNRDFYVEFDLTPASLNDYVTAIQSHGNGRGNSRGNHRDEIIWTNNRYESSANKIIDQHTKSGQNYSVRLLYRTTGGKEGYLTYYLKYEGSTQWYEIETKYINLNGLKAAAISVDGGDIGVSCGTVIPEVPPVEMCDNFSGPAQSWEISSPAEHSSTAIFSAGNVIEGAANGRDIGFHTTTSSGFDSCGARACEASRTLLLPVKPEFVPEFPRGQRVDVYDGVTLQPGLYSNITIPRGVTLTLSGGVYWIESLTINGTLDIENKTQLNIKKLDLKNGKINTHASPDDLYIVAHTNDAMVSLSVDDSVDRTEFSALILSENMVGISGYVYIRGAVTSKHLTMSGGRIIKDLGSCKTESVNRLEIVPKTAYGMTCERIPVKFQVKDNNGQVDRSYSGTLTASVTSELPGKSCWSLVKTEGECQTSEFSVQLENGERTLFLGSEIAGRVSVSGSIGNLQDSAGPYRFAPYGLRINGSSPVKVVAGRQTNVIVEAIADTGAGCGVITDYGRGESGEDKTLKIHSLEYIRPKAANYGVAVYGNQLVKGEKITRVLRFKGGVASLPIVYRDAGEIQFQLSDPDWLPTICEKDSENCEDHEGDWQGLKGRAVVYARPYTFALCNSGTTNIENASGTSEGGNGFVAAGEAFGLKVKPVVWLEGDGSGAIDANQNANAPVDSSAMCGRQVTENFYADGAPAATVELSIPVGKNIKPHSPIKDGAVSGKLTSSALSNKQIKNTAFSASWSEVGSVWLQADTQANYLGMDVNMGRRPVGRFYPAYVEIQNGNTFAYPAGQNGFAYLGQEFTASFSVLPKSKTGQIVKNYAHFKEGLQVKLGLEAVDGSNNSFGSRLSPQGLWRDWASTTTSMTWKLDRRGQGTGTTTVEPPWRSGNSQWGLHITKDQGNNDPTAIRSASGANVAVEGSSATLEMAPFAVTPELRYGRMRLEDVTVPVSQDAEVPARVEYYLNSQEGFVLNRDDDASLFGSRHGCSELIFPNAMYSKLADTPASVAVNDGEGILRVNHPPLWDGTNGVMQGYREQVRLGQQLASVTPTCTSGSAATSSQPWLQFNWSGEGDTDPSAVVTFGVYRGNDRIIYRGEKGVNHLLN